MSSITTSKHTVHLLRLPLPDPRKRLRTPIDKPSASFPASRLTVLPQQLSVNSCTWPLALPPSCQLLSFLCVFPKVVIISVLHLKFLLLLRSTSSPRSPWSLPRCPQAELVPSLLLWSSGLTCIIVNCSYGFLLPCFIFFEDKWIIHIFVFLRVRYIISVSLNVGYTVLKRNQKA